MDTLDIRFKKEIAPSLQATLGLKNSMATPQIIKVIVNMGVKDAVADKKNIERATRALGQITGQKAKITRAKKSIATFKLRQGDQIGAMVTLRGKRMYEFVDRLVTIVFPRIKDFRGIPRTSFDGKGNYTLGFSEYSVFPEIDPSSVERIQGMEIVIVTTANTNQEGEKLLEALGMPFTKTGGKTQ